MNASPLEINYQLEEIWRSTSYGDLDMEGNIFLILFFILIMIPTVIAMIERINRFKDSE